MTPWNAMKADTFRLYGAFSWGRLVKSAIMDGTFRVVVTLRLCQCVATSRDPARLLLPFFRLLHHMARSRMAVGLSWRTEIGAGFALTHAFGTRISSGARIGQNVTLLQGVTIGQRHKISSCGERLVLFPVGEVAKPGIYPVLGSLSLLNIIPAAGGTTAAASNEITIQRHSDGSVLKAKVSRDAFETLESDIEIQPGDKVIVPRAGIVYVIGNVNRPGGFVTQNEGEISLLQAIAMAAGVTGTASLDRTKLIRKTSAGYVEIPVPLKEILKGRERDLQMTAEDILYVPNRPASRCCIGVCRA